MSLYNRGLAYDARGKYEQLKLRRELDRKLH